MHKSKDISKFDIDWQVKRVSLKKYKTYQEKCKVVSEFLHQHPNRGDQERVLNYLEGLSMAYKGEDRQYILDYKDKLAKFDVSDSVRHNNELSGFTDLELASVANDNMARAKKFLSHGYRHQELIDFIRKIYKYVGDTKKLKVLNDLVEQSFEIPNTHKFFF